MFSLEGDILLPALALVLRLNKVNWRLRLKLFALPAVAVVLACVAASWRAFSPHGVIVSKELRLRHLFTHGLTILVT